MPEPGIYVFDAADPDLTLMPMAVRRALDVSGVHLSLRGWQGLGLSLRRQLVQLGAAEQVDVAAVSAALRGCEAEQRPVAVLVEPEPALGPTPELLAAVDEQVLGAQWVRLSALDRYVLASLARRGKLSRLSEALGEILAGR